MKSSSTQPTPITGYAPVNGLNMYYEVHGGGDPVVLLHGSYMTISDNLNWTVWIDELAQVRQVIAVEMQGHGRTADIAREFSYATRAPILFIHGDADGVRLDHIAEMFRLKGDEIMGDMRPRAASRLAILPDTTHVTLMERMAVIVPLMNDFFDARLQGEAS